MNIPAIPAMAAALLMLAACGGEVRTDSRTTAVDPVPTAADRIGEIAGDKTMTADLMRRSFEKGTFDDALSLALADSALAAEVISVIRADARYASLLREPAAPQTVLASTAKTSARSRTTRSNASGTQRSGDPLDKAEQTMSKTNEKLDQAGRVRDQIEEARRKAEGILRPR